MTIEEMYKWRKKNHTFDDFIKAAQNSCVDDFEIEAIADDKFLLSWCGLKEETKSKKAIYEWWTDSGKEINKK